FKCSAYGIYFIYFALSIKIHGKVNAFPTGVQVYAIGYSRDGVSDFSLIERINYAIGGSAVKPFFFSSVAMYIKEIHVSRRYEIRITYNFLIIFFKISIHFLLILEYATQLIAPDMAHRSTHFYSSKSS